MKKLQTSISPDYVKGWDTSKAIRELIQNYLDSRQEFSCGGYLKWEDGRATIKDYGPGLELRHFAMGISEKGFNAKGKYGEGLKLALLTMAREGIPVELWTRGNIIRPIIEYNDSYETDLLAFEISPLPYPTHRGTTIKFNCTENELEQGKSYFIEFYKRSEDNFQWLVQDQISLPGGFIFVNGTRVGESKDSIYSYHLDEKLVGDIGNRDREVVDMSAAIKAVSEIITKCTNSTVLETILGAAGAKMPAWEIGSLKIYYWDIPSRNWEYWVRASHAVFGEYVAFPTGSTTIDKQAEYYGYRLIYGLAWQWQRLLEGVGAIYPANKILFELEHTDEAVDEKDLHEFELENLRYAKRVVKKYYTKDAPLKVQIVENLTILSGGNEQRVMGLWNSDKETIFMDREMLDNKFDALSVLLHEAIHQISGFEDCTADFAEILLHIAVEALMGLEK